MISYGKLKTTSGQTNYMSDIFSILDNPAEVTKLQTLLGIASPNELFILMDKGSILNIREGNPNGHSYADCIRSYVKHLKSTKDIKEKAELERVRLKEQAELDKAEQRRSRMSANTFGGETDDAAEEMKQLTLEKLKEDIKRTRADTERLVIDNSIKKKSYLDKQELIAVTTPFILELRNTLVTISHEFPETQKRIDDSMEELHSLGVKMLEEVQRDTEEYVEDILSMDV